MRARIAELATAQRVEGLGEQRLAAQRALGPALLPLGPLARRLVVAAGGLERLDRGEGGVGRERVAVLRAPELLDGTRRIAALEPDLAGEEARRGAIVAREAAAQERFHRAVAPLQSRDPGGAREQPRRLELDADLLQRRGRRGDARGRRRLRCGLGEVDLEAAAAGTSATASSSTAPRRIEWSAVVPIALGRPLTGRR